MFHSFEERRIECELVFFLNTVLNVLSTSRFVLRLYHRGCLSARPIRRSGDVRCEMCTGADLHRTDIPQPKAWYQCDDAFPCSITGFW
jgi:hypothetical protein